MCGQANLAVRRSMKRLNGIAQHVDQRLIDKIRIDRKLKVFWIYCACQFHSAGRKVGRQKSLETCEHPAYWCHLHVKRERPGQSTVAAHKPVQSFTSLC